MRVSARSRLPQFRWLGSSRRSSLPGAGDESVDPLTQAVEEGFRLGNGHRRLPRAEFDRMRQLVEEAREGAPRGRIQAELMDLVREYPSDPRPQIFALQNLAPEPTAGTSAIWQRLHERFPRSQPVVIQTLRRTMRFSGMEAAWDLVREEFPSIPDEPDRLALYISLLEELRDFAGVDAAVRHLLDMPAATAFQLHGAAMLYRRRGSLMRAAEVTDQALARFPNHQPLIRLQGELAPEIDMLSVNFPGVDLSTDRVSVALLRHVLATLAKDRPPEQERASQILGRVVLISATLGVGGAERQFVATALALQSAINDGRRIADCSLIGPVEVISRSLYTRRDGDFFLRELKDAGIRVEQYVNYADFGGRVRRSCATNIELIFKYLPHDMAEGTRKLADVLKVLEPEVVHIWQDGAIIACLLAALLAEVPRIVLSVRTLPSIDRLDRYRPEYEVLYRSAMTMPGVRLVANSAAVQRRYAMWLGVPATRIGVIHNGVRTQPTGGDVNCQALADRLDLGRADDEFVVGTVMRFDRNKRPLLWVEVALAVLAREPSAKFILAGDGPLLESAQELVNRSDYGDRFLFVGRTDRIGFWLERMSVFLLLSVYESLPNVLIEAQLAGVPVVATPAGGVAETFLDGETGTLLSDSAIIDPEDVADAILRWRISEEAAARVAERARETARERFSVESMLEATVAAYAD
jgi:glycosyltransferase involved in cell wall biosynthesis